jgi:TonB family protein
LIKKLATQISASAPYDTRPATTIAGSEVKGTQLHGEVNHEPVSGAVYSTRVNRRFVSLVSIIGDQDEEARSAWNTVRATLTVGPPVVGIKIADGTEKLESIGGGVMNGKAISLPRPEYPKAARSAHASGTVTVQVVIDETGNVTSAHAVEGHPLLEAASVEAAKTARFSPTRLCGEPVRVTGIIVYNFVAQ